MKFTYENLGTNTYLVYEIGAADELDSMSLGMLTNNSIHGFAPASFTQMDATKYIKYNVSAKVSVKQLFSGPVNKKRLLGVFSGVVEAMLSAEDYMLDPATILLDTDYIFADVTTSKTELICLPIVGLQQNNQNLAMFFKNILFTTQFDQTENCDHVATLINYMNSNSNLVLEDFKSLLHGLTGSQAKPQAQPKYHQEAQPVVQQPVAPQPVSQPVEDVAQPVIPEKPQRKVPVVAPIPEMPATEPKGKAAKPAKSEKNMSFFYLMQHYNKENAAIYKAQQEEAKAQKEEAKSQKASVAPAKTKAASEKKKVKPVASIPIPGQDDFEIPGQQAPVAYSQPAVKQEIPVQPVVQKREVVAQTPVYQPPVMPVQPVQSISFGETSILGDDMMDETTILGGAVAQAKNDPHLIRNKNKEKISLNKPLFRIGKERSYVDYFISDNAAISRSHANIVSHDGEFFVVDTNSTNHTYVNGNMIHSNEEVKLSHGTIIRLANEDFEFKLY